MGETLSFSSVLEILKRENNVKAFRMGWNGMHQWIRLQRPDGFSKMTQQYIYFEKVVSAGGDGSIGKYVRIPWLASQADMLENDWVVERDEVSTAPQCLAAANQMASTPSSN